MKFKFVISLLIFSLCAYAENNLSEELYIACAEGNLELVCYLIEQGADVNACYDNGYNPPYDIAYENGHWHIVEYLAAHGAKTFDCLLLHKK